jgi:3-dehydroquinate synthetase
LKDTEEILTYMRQDKKNASGEICCVLLQDMGVPVIDIAVDENEIRDALLKIK